MTLINYAELSDQTYLVHNLAPMNLDFCPLAWLYSVSERVLNMQNLATKQIFSTP